MFRLIRQLANKELGEWRRLADIRELGKLSDHQLADIGLRRDQLFMLEAKPPVDDGERPLREPVYRPGFEPCG
jgi:uncharacterized protein YjiS (DUF1127 family)